MAVERDQGLQEITVYIDSQTNTKQYDPHQNEAERRDIRNKYRILSEKTQGRCDVHDKMPNAHNRHTENRKEIIAQNDTSKLYNTIAKTNVLFESGKRPCVYTTVAPFG